MGFATADDSAVRILALDGGDTRCLSQLVLLDELMNRLKYDYGRQIRPCEYFRSITGVGAAGVLAILLGVLGLPIDRATEAFGKICERTFPAEGCSETVRSAKLADAIRSLLDELHIPASTRLQDGLKISAGCRVSICYSAMAASGCRMFRNYESRYSSYDPTIIEAAQATWATPGLFSSIRVGTVPMQEQLVSAVNGFNNPTLQAISEAQEVLGREKLISSILSLGCIQAGLFPTSPMEVATRAAQETETTAENLQRRFGTHDVYFRFSVEHVIEVEYVNLESHFNAIVAHAKVSENISSIDLDRLLRSRIGGSMSSHGLPPLSAFFIMRIEPMDEITTALERDISSGPVMAIVTGLGGTGKTQISLKYAYDHDDEYDHILFIDASPTESLEKTMISRIRSIDRQLHPTDSEEARVLLENPEGNLTRNWFMIMDNADDTNVDLRDYIPQCDHGSVLITSRNAALGDLDPDGHIALDVMSREEAVEALLSAALGPTVLKNSKTSKIYPPRSIPRTEKDREYATQIVEELGYLPLAVIQAACYIKKHKCLHDYRKLLIDKSSRSNILRWPASVQRDRLKYAHSTYAAFDTTISALSSRALQFLGVISFVHFSDFPRALIGVAASLGFGYQPYDLIDQPSEFKLSVDLLKTLFSPHGHWEQMELDGLLEELQTYSLVTLTLVSSVITLRFHPLLHGWANDRLSKDRSLFKAAAIRLLVCGTNKDEQHLWPFLSPHIDRFALTTEDLHLNDRAALAGILGANGQTTKALDIWKEIHAIVEKLWGKEHLQTTRATLGLASAYGDEEDWDRMASMQRDVVRIRKDALGGDHLETAEAMAALGRSCRANDQLYDEAMELEVQVLRVRKDILGPAHRDIAEALRDLAATRMLQKDYDEAQSLLVEATDMLTTLVGKSHVATIKVMEQRAKCYKRSGDRDEEIKLKQEIIDLVRTVHGDMHASTLDAMAKIGKAFSEQSQWSASERMWRQIVDGRREMLGNHHESTIQALEWLAHSVFNQDHRYAEAEILWREVAAGKLETHGEHHVDTLDALEWVGETLLKQEHYTDCETLIKEVIAEKSATLDENHAPIEAFDILVHSIYAQDRYAEAEKLWKEIIEMKRRILGEDAESTIGAVCWLAIVLKDQGRYADSEVLLREVLTKRRLTVGEYDMSTLEALDLLVHVIYSQQRYAEAAQLWREIVAVKQVALGERHEDTLGAMFWIGHALYSQECYAEAETVWRELERERRAAFGDQYEGTLEALYWLGLLFGEKNRHAEAVEVWKELVAGKQATLGDDHAETQEARDHLAEAQREISVEKQQNGKDLFEEDSLSQGFVLVSPRADDEKTCR